MPEPTLSLHRKLAQIMWEAERIPKRGKAPAVMGGYPFVQVGDAADFIRKQLGEHVLSMLPTAIRIVGQVDRETKNGGNMTTVDLITTWTITDGESGESVSFESFGAGADGGDKYSGKASTSAMKYALLTGFLLSTGDDTEAFATPEQRTERNPRVGAADHEPPAPPTFEGTPDGGMIGIAEAGKAGADFEVRETPDGWATAFRLVSGRKSFKVIAEDDLAVQVAARRADIEGKTVTAWGRVSEETFQPEGTRKKIPYTVLYLSRITAGDLALPPTATTQEPDAAVASPGEAAAISPASPTLAL